MADRRAEQVNSRGDSLFTSKMVLNSLHQEIADHFYPERADFTIQRYLGNEFAANLTTSYPVLVRRELHSLLSIMLRSEELDWFQASVMREDRIGRREKAWLENASQSMKRAMYDPVANLVRALHATDGDFTAFGNGVAQLQHNRKANALLYTNRHLRDCAWAESAEGKVDELHRKWTLEKRQAERLLARHEGAVIPQKWSKYKDPFHKVNLRHVVMSSEEWEECGGKKFNTKWASIIVDADNDELILQEPSLIFQYIVPRWQLVSGSQYGFSPCTVAGLPDARLCQQIALTILEAGEKAANPPLLAAENVLRSDINTWAGGVTWWDSNYDEKTGKPLQVMEHDWSGMPIGDKIQDFVREQLKEAFYLNKIAMPPPVDAKQMTAFEVGQRVQEYVRNALPLFEPMEQDYNSQLCEMTWELLMAHGVFGSVWDIPQGLRGQDTKFIFKSPIHETAKKARGATFAQAKAMIADAIALDPTAGKVVKVTDTIKWALDGLGFPTDLVNDDATIQKAAKAMAQQQQVGNTVAAMHTGGQAAQSIADAANSFKEVQQQ